MKKYLLPIIGSLLGASVAYWGLGLLFVTPFDKLLPQGLMPLGLAALSAFALCWLNPKAWIVLAASVALPALVTIALVLLQLQAEGRGDDGKWLWVAAAVFGACAIPSGLARWWRGRSRAL